MALQWKDKLNQALTIAGGNPGGIPNVPYDPPKEDPNKPWVPAPKRDKLQADASSRQIRDRLKPFTKGGPADYDKEGGSLRDLPASLRIQILKGAKAEAPLTIRGGRIPNTIRGTTHIDSPQMDRLIENYRRQQGPQLPKFV